MIKILELSHDKFRQVKKHCDEIVIQFASTADETKSLYIGIPFIKIEFGEISNVSYLRYMGSKKMLVILIIGVSFIADIDISLKALRNGGATDIPLLHCTTYYKLSMCVRKRKA